MASSTSDRELLADIAAQKKPSRKSRAQTAPHESRGDEAARRLGYQFGRRGRVVSEFILKKLIADRDLVTLLEVEHIRARLKTLAEDEGFSMANHVRHSLGIFFFMIVVVGALLVDYRIIHEFWTRVAMDDVGRVAASLRLSVYFKSAQVIFATLAFHFMLETLGERGRKIFIRLIFALTAVMLIGFGIIVAMKWLPPGASLFGVSLNAASHSSQQVLAALGLAGPDASAASQDSDLVRSIETVIWLVSLSLIFVIVTGVGALSLQGAVRQFQILSGAKVDDPDGTDARLQLIGNRSQRLEQLKVRARHYGIDLKKTESGDVREERDRAIRRCLLDFAGSYVIGLNEYRDVLFGVFSKIRESQAKELLKDLQEVMEKMPNVIAEFLADRYQKHHEASGDDETSSGSNIFAFSDKKKTGSDR